MERLLLFLAPAVVAGVLSFLLTPLAARLARAVGAMDRPDARKVHREPIPRLGGLAVIASVALVLSSPRLGIPWLRPWAPPGLDAGLALGALPIVLVSLWDDVRSLPAVPRLLAQLLGALLAVGHGVALGPVVHLFGRELVLGPLAPVLSVAFLVVVTNAFNLVDGLDGLSAGLAFISAVSLAGVFAVVGSFGMAGAALVLAGALAGFLPKNVYPARVFLGDAGANAIGFALGCFALRGGATLSAGFAVLLPLFTVGLPIAETVVSALRRLIRRYDGGSGGVFTADRDHIHHRLLALGLDHRKAVLFLYGVGVLLAGGGFLSIFVSSRRAGLLLGALLLAAFVGIARLGYDEFALVRKGVALRFYETPVLQKALFVVFFDLAISALALWAAIGIRFDDWVLSYGAPRGVFLELLAVVCPITVLTFFRFGLYRGSWRLANVDDFLRASFAVGVSAALSFAAALFVAVDAPLVPLFLAYTFLFLALVNGSRASYRVFQHRSWRHRLGGAPCVVYGAGLGGAAALRELLSNPALDLRPVGFLDDDPEKVGRTVHGYPVFGPPDALASLAAKRSVEAVVLASKKLAPERVDAVAALCRAKGLRLLRMEIAFEELAPAAAPDAAAAP